MLTINVYRNNMGDASNDGVSHRYDRLTLVNVPGPVDTPSDDAPVAKLVSGPFNSVRIVPLEVADRWHMFGGNFGFTSDSRFAEAVKQLTAGEEAVTAVKIFDRIE